MKCAKDKKGYLLNVTILERGTKRSRKIPESSSETGGKIKVQLESQVCANANSPSQSVAKPSIFIFARSNIEGDLENVPIYLPLVIKSGRKTPLDCIILTQTLKWKCMLIFCTQIQSNLRLGDKQCPVIKNIREDIHSLRFQIVCLHFQIG